MIDKIFKAYDVRAATPNPLDEDAAWKVGHATGLYLQRSRQNLPVEQRVRLEDSVVIGRDMRPSSPKLASALADGFRSTGMNVIDIGMVDTAMVYFAINHLDCAGGVQTTASHNPVGDNGFKISGAHAKPIGSSSGLDDIKRIAGRLRIGQTGLHGQYEQVDLWAAYREHVLKFLDLNRKLRVVVDAGNGMAGKMVPAVFGGLANLEIIPMLFETEGSFVHDPNPLVESNLAMLKEKVLATKPDLGICFDGDADRCVVIDENARTVGCDILTALIAEDYLKMPRNRGATIVYDLRSSRIVPEKITELGGVARRDRVGHAFIKQTMAQTKAVFGGELSGHMYFRDNYCADSAAIALARVLSIVSAQNQPTSALVAPLLKYSQSGELNFTVEEKDAKIRELADVYRKASVDYLDGITVDCGPWWFNVRKSNTQPMLRLNLETRCPQMLQEKLAELKKLLGDPVYGH